MEVDSVEIVADGTKLNSQMLFLSLQSPAEQVAPLYFLEPWMKCIASSTVHDSSSYHNTQSIKGARALMSSMSIYSDLLLKVAHGTAF